jgi:hypothetical protein
VTSPRQPSSATALLIVLLIVVATAVACSGRVRDEVVTEANRDAISARVAQSSLSDEDKNLFVAFLQRVDAAEAHGRWADTKSPYDGRTVGAIIADEHARQNAARAAEAQRLKSIASQKADAASVTAAIGKALSVWVLDTRVAQFGVLPYSYIKLTAENRSAKEITSFAGRLTIRDRFGEQVTQVSIDVTQSIASGNRMTWEELVTDVTVSRSAVKNLKFEWAPKVVMFEDGSKIGPVKLADIPIPTPR